MSLRLDAAHRALVWRPLPGPGVRHGHRPLVPPRSARRAPALGAAAGPDGVRAPMALLCTDPHTIVAWFLRRWQVEAAFQAVHTHLGAETQRQWSAPAIARTTPVLLRGRPLTPGRAAWYLNRQVAILRGTRTQARGVFEGGCAAWTSASGCCHWE